MQSAYQLSPTGLVANEKSSWNLVAQNIEVLKQGIGLIGRLDDHLYIEVNRALSISGVGSHFRHCVDFYHSFLAGLASGRINYDCREREEQIEKSRLFAIATLRSINEGLGGLPASEDQREIAVLLEDSSTLPNDNSDSGWSRSTIKRELQFLLSHTIHHYSLIALALRVQGFDPGSEFGVAPSTLKYWRKTA